LLEKGWTFGLLGPLEVRHGGVLVPVTAAKQRVLIAVLALAAGEPVTKDRLIACVWGERPPASVRNTLLNYVLRLRHVLRTDTGPGPLMTSSAGYCLDVDADAIDVHRFGSLLNQARSGARAGQAGSAVGLLNEALGWWRGEPLVDVPSELLHREVAPALVEQRLAAREDRIDLDLRLGRDRDLATELATLTIAHPLRERLWAQLMLALYRGGRTGEALAAYRQASAVLADELGLDPGPELQKLHQAMLTNDPDLTITEPVSQATEPHSTVSPVVSSVVPRQLPASTGYFVGRSGELRHLSARQEAASGAQLMAIIAIGGTAGIGKTSLALRWAHQHVDHFPDGQLYVDLRGFDPTRTPVPAEAAIRGFLDALGVALAQIPVSPEAQAGLYRSLLAGKRVLVVLDNARAPDQVRPLLPGVAGCVVLVTSRNQLSGLVAVDGAHSLTLDLLTPQEARELLSRRLGAQRVAAEPESVEELIELCAGLPLALNITAARAAVQPAFPLAVFAAQLREACGRLSALDNGDASANVRAVFSWSYHTLDPAGARMFRLLGLNPGPDVTVPAAASLAATGHDQARAALDELARANLLAEHAPGRYTFHDLLRVYAAEQARTHDSDEEQHLALQRALDHYLHTAHLAARLLHPARELIVLPQPQPGVTPEVLADDQQAWDWFTAEHQVLLAAVAQASAHRLGTHVCQLSWTLADFLERLGHWHDYQATCTSALTAAQHLGDLAEQALIHRRLARAHAVAGAYPEAQTHLDQAIEVCQRLGDSFGQAHSRHNLAKVLDLQDRYGEALDQARQARLLYRVCGNSRGQASILNSIGWLHTRTGDYSQALAYCQEALELDRNLGNDEGGIWDSLGHAHHHLGHHQQAIECYQYALNLYGKKRERYEEAATYTRLGDTHHAAGDDAAARDAWEQAHSLFEDLQHPEIERVRQKLTVYAIRVGHSREVVAGPK
jgi:DNA-binding SARP family transcriptional activator/tetratricopeptide (TPR) repeat protein